jgi:hypothetical protein
VKNQVFGVVVTIYVASVSNSGAYNKRPYEVPWLRARGNNAVWRPLEGFDGSALGLAFVKNKLNVSSFVSLLR